MNYRKIYASLVMGAYGRPRTVNGVFETHHIVPKCLGGSDDDANLVNLTPEEHYVAHQLLVKMHPGNGKLLWAAIAMTGTGHGRGNGRHGNKLYGWLRRKFIENQMGRPYSEETRRKIGIKSKERNRGKNHPLFGTHHSAETRRKISLGNIGKMKGIPKGPFSEEHKRKISEGRQKFFAAGGEVNFKGCKHTPETRAKMSAYWASKREAKPHAS
jgi:hypothetical protein